MTFRLRLILYYSSLLVGILLLFGGAVFATLQWAMLNQVDITLDKVVDDVLSETQSTIETDPNGNPRMTAYVPRLDAFRTPGVFVQIWEVNDGLELVSSSQNLGSHDKALDQQNLLASEEVRSEVTINGVHLRVVTRPVIVQGQQVANIQAASSLSTVETASDRLGIIMVGCGLIALLVSLMLGDLMARRVLRPVSAIANTARTIAQTDDLSQRIPYNRPDELGSMVITFNETLDRLQRLFESQGRFLSDVSHEFRTPLTTIRGNIDLIRRYGNDPHSLEVIEEEVKHMSVLVADLLMLAKADAGQIPFTFDRLDLSRFVVKDVYTHIQKMAHNIHQVELGHVEEDVTIQADVNYLRQLFNHLVTNAVRYTPEGGVIRIWQTTSFNQAQVHISDTGVGIPPEDLPHIFERFYRVDKARSRAAGGTGLGLSIAQWIAEMHGGKIVVTSSVGQGTIFTVSLPIPENLARTQVSEEAQRRMAV